MTGPGELPARLALVPGESVELELPGLGGAGYLWESALDGPEGAVELSWHRGGAGPRAVGAAGRERLRLTAVTPGSVRLVLAQRRPWEADIAPRARHEVQVVVEDRASASGRGAAPGTDSP